MEQNTLGKLIGIVETSDFQCKAAGNSDVTVKIKIDFTNTTDEDIKKWLVADRKIAFRSPRNKSLSKEKYLECNGKTFDASKIAEKPQLTPAELAAQQLDSLLRQGLISQDTYNEAMAKVNN